MVTVLGKQSDGKTQAEHLPERVGQRGVLRGRSSFIPHSSSAEVKILIRSVRSFANTENRNERGDRQDNE